MTSFPLPKPSPSLTSDNLEGQKKGSSLKRYHNDQCFVAISECEREREKSGNQAIIEHVTLPPPSCGLFSIFLPILLWYTHKILGNGKQYNSVSKTNPEIVSHLTKLQMISAISAFEFSRQKMTTGFGVFLNVDFGGKFKHTWSPKQV